MPHILQPQLLQCLLGLAVEQWNSEFVQHSAADWLLTRTVCFQNFTLKLPSLLIISFRSPFIEILNTYTKAWHGLMSWWSKSIIFNNRVFNMVTWVVVGFWYFGPNIKKVVCCLQSHIGTKTQQDTYTMQR